MEGDESGYDSSCPRTPGATPSSASPSPTPIERSIPQSLPPHPPRTSQSNKRSSEQQQQQQSSQDGEENEGDPNNPSAPLRKGRKLTSPVWDHFERLTINNETKAKCVHCDKIMSANTVNGTSHLRDHLDRRCSKKNLKVDIRQKLLSVTRKSSGTCSVDATNFNQEVSRKELASMVIMHEYPLAIVDHIGFRRFVNSLNPSFKIITRPTLRADIMKMFTSEKAGLKKVLENTESKIAITTDMWTASNQRKGYMAVTAHYIDHFWVLQNKTIR